MANHSPRPTIVFYSNCAGQLLADQLRQLPSIISQFDVHWIRNFSVQSAGDELFDPSILPRCQFFFEQVGNFQGDPRRQVGDLKDLPLPAHCRRIRFPPLFMATLWPFVGLDQRSEAWRGLPWMIEGPYPQYICNRLIIKIMENEPDPDRVYERFSKIHLSSEVELDRLHELTMSKIRALDQESDVTVGDYVNRNFAKKRLFLMQLHPAGPILRHLCEGVFQALDQKNDGVAILLDKLEKSRGIGTYDAPIHPEIVDHFDLKWARELTYRHHAEGSFSYDEFIRRYIRFEWTPQYYQGIYLADQGQLNAAEVMLREAVAINPSDDIVEGLRQVEKRQRARRPLWRLAEEARVAASYASARIARYFARFS